MFVYYNRYQLQTEETVPWRIIRNHAETCEFIFKDENMNKDIEHVFMQKHKGTTSSTHFFQSNLAATEHNWKTLKLQKKNQVLNLQSKLFIQILKGSCWVREHMHAGTPRIHVHAQVHMFSGEERKKGTFFSENSITLTIFLFCLGHNWRLFRNP